MQAVQPTHIKINTSKIFAPFKSVGYINLTEVDSITRTSYLELIQAQKIKNLPYVIALVQDKDFSSIHCFDGFNIYQWSKHQPTNPVTGNIISNIFYFSIMCDEKYRTEYLGKSSDIDEKKIFLRRYFEAVEEDAEAQFRLGLSYDGCLEIKKDYKKAAYWWQLAATQNHAESQFQLGHYYYEGKGVKKNYAEAFKWWEKAALQNHFEAIIDVIYFLEQGLSVKQDFGMASIWRHRAQNLCEFKLEW